MIRISFSVLCALFLLKASLLFADNVDSRFIDMVYIKGGEFTMGSRADDKLTPDPDELPSFRATVSSFYMGKYEISYSQWKYVYDWAIQNGYDFDSEGQCGASYLNVLFFGEGNSSVSNDKNQPVVNVSWYDVIKWCNAKSEMEGLRPLYYTDSSKEYIYRSGIIDVSVNKVRWGVDGYFIPTEAQWEYAARAGSKSIYPWGNNYKQMVKYANTLDVTAYKLYRARIYIDIDDGYVDTAPVNSFSANAFGLHNMIGNVWEWVFDLYGEYTDVHVIEPRGALTGYERIIRGGCFFTSFVEGLRVANRYPERPTLADSFTGFRVARNAS